MATLLMRLAGPLQAWGTQGGFTVRETGGEPSFSALVGLLCCALGRDRTEPLDDLTRLRMGVRVEREGRLVVDYQTVMGGRGKGEVAVTRRHYLADAHFLVGLEGEDRALLERLDEALRAPRWQLFLGRRSCVPSPPVALPPGRGVRDGSLEEVLSSEPWQGREWEPRPDSLRLVLTATGPSDGVQSDRPVSFEHGRRRYGPRATVSSRAAL